MPFSPSLEDLYVPTPERIAAAVREVAGGSRAGMTRRRSQKLGMPKWGLSMTEGRVVAWLVDEGAEIAVGDEVAEVETEKINGAVETPGGRRPAPARGRGRRRRSRSAACSA